MSEVSHNMNSIRKIISNNKQFGLYNNMSYYYILKSNSVNNLYSTIVSNLTSTQSFIADFTLIPSFVLSQYFSMNYFNQTSY